MFLLHLWRPWFQGCHSHIHKQNRFEKLVWKCRWGFCSRRHTLVLKRHHFSTVRMAKLCGFAVTAHKWNLCWKLANIYGTNNFMFLPGQILSPLLPARYVSHGPQGATHGGDPIPWRGAHLGTVWPPPSGGFNYGEVGGFLLHPRRNTTLWATNTQYFSGQDTEIKRNFRWGRLGGWH